MALLSEGLTQVVIPVSALIGIGFALIQWLLVSKVKVSNDSSSNGYAERLIEEEEAEEGVDNLEVSIKCAEIQNAISVGKLSLSFLMLVFQLLPLFFSYMSIEMICFSPIMLFYCG